MRNRDLATGIKKTALRSLRNDAWPLAKIPAVGLLYKNSVVNATGKNAILKIVTKYSIHRSSEFISDVCSLGNAREGMSLASNAESNQSRRVKRLRNQSAGTYLFRVEVAPRLPPNELLWLQSWKPLFVATLLETDKRRVCLLRGLGTQLFGASGRNASDKCQGRGRHDGPRRAAMPEGSILEMHEWLVRAGRVAAIR